ncbi:MAG: putative transcriptional regulatory protein NarL [Cryomorphaceae bacterium]|nr:MAG: putative transcriptional regulatory protein NarL [Cryomorphaceae bacterium]|tara:strand:+ start:3489 stop:4148 length:660 start_codon:yes stop_codon:yes gene_type:complete
MNVEKDNSDKSKTINIIIADDHTIFLEGITALISSEYINVIANCKNGQEVLDFLKAQYVDLVISDINMPVMDGITLVKKIKKLYPKTKIMMLSMYEERHIINKAIKAGANGYMSKNSGKKDILNAIESCMRGEKAIFTRQSKFTQKSIQNTDKSIKEISLTNREKQVLKLITQEASNSDIALSLNISKRTVETHKKNIALKLGATNTIGLIKIALKVKF